MGSWWPHLGRSGSVHTASSTLELANVTKHLLISQANVFSDGLVFGGRKAVARNHIVCLAVVVQLAMEHLLVVVILLVVRARDYSRITGAAGV